MIVGEAKTDAEATEFAQVAKAALDELGLKNAISPTSVKDGIEGGQTRYSMVWEDGKIIALGVGSRFYSDQGPGVLGELCIAAKDYSDKVRAMDLLLLFALNTFMAEDRFIVRTPLPAGTPLVYYRDMLDMKLTEAGIDTITGEKSYRAQGHATTMLQAIFKRRPEWVLSL